mmetsp:Transcript_46804/g.100239  ORF Transcript_46804/g.100239 Transcript_46804/m.100239 type:complete len:117 (-) Transcript_46804:484-834(-)
MELASRALGLSGPCKTKEFATEVGLTNGCLVCSCPSTQQHGSASRSKSCQSHSTLSCPNNCESKMQYTIHLRLRRWRAKGLAQASVLVVAAEGEEQAQILLCEFGMSKVSSKLEGR